MFKGSGWFALRRWYAAATSCSLLGLLAIAGPHEAVAQDSAHRWVVDPSLSLAWYQMEPHLAHLWATTCPEERTWQPGEGRSMGWASDSGYVRLKEGYAAVSSGQIPLFLRPAAEPVCAPYVTGEVLVTDTATLAGVRGAVVVDASSLTTGDDRRDALQRRIMETNRYREIRFTVDSLVDVQVGDTLTATAMGTFALHGVERPMLAEVETWPEAGGFRVLAQFSMPAPEMTAEYKLSKWKLGLGVGTKIWRRLHMGVDLVFKPAPL